MSVEKTPPTSGLALSKSDRDRDHDHDPNTNTETTHQTDCDTESREENEPASLDENLPPSSTRQQRMPVFVPSNREKPMRQPNVPPAAEDLRSGQMQNFKLF